MSKQVFLTGGSGFLGKHTIPALRKAGYQVTALVRSDRSEAIVAELGARTVRGDIGRVDAFEAELAGMDLVIHAASPVEFWGPWSFFQANIVDATRTLACAAERRGVGRFIYISSESVLQDRKPLLDIDEDEPYPSHPNSFYGRAKKEAELFLLGNSDEKPLSGDMEVIILRPTFIWGPGVPALDTMIHKIESGDFMWIDGGRTIIEMVHVENVVKAIVLACRQGRDRGVYFITDGAARPVREFLSELFASRGVTPPTKSIPGWLARMAAASVEGAYRLFGSKKAPPLSRFELSFVDMPRRYRIDRAKTELGYKPERFS